MKFEIEGTVMQVMPIVEGSSAKGPWRRQDVLIEHETGKWPKSALLTFFGDAVDALSAVRRGDVVAAEMTVEARESGGRFYNNVNGRNIRLLNGAQPAPAPAQSHAAAVGAAMKGKFSEATGAPKAERDAAWTAIKGLIEKRGLQTVLAAIEAMPSGYKRAEDVRIFVDGYAPVATPAPEPGEEEDLPF